MTAVITIDGPSGSGKGTISRLVATATGFSLLDSGALYRLTALSCLLSDTDCGEEAAVSGIARALDVEFAITDSGITVLLGGQDVSRDIRKEEVGMTASTVAAYPKVREALLQRQRDFRQPPGLVADGRDMGTVVFPDAELKIFLTASAEERANRRVKQLQESGADSIDRARILADIQARDEKDSSRSASPLVAASDAIELDSTAMSIDEVYKTVLAEAVSRGLA